MAVTTKGTTFATNEQVTATKLNNLVDAATFAPGAVDEVTTTLSSGAIIVRSGGVDTLQLADGAVETAKIADSTTTTDGVTFSKMRQIADMKAVANTSGGTAVPSEVDILDDDTMEAASATTLATSKSIKDYIGKQLKSEVLHVQDEKTTGTTGGSSISGTQTRTLNTVVKNTIDGASLSSNQVTLPDGDYWIKAYCPFFRTQLSRALIYDVSTGSDYILGGGSYGDSGSPGSSGINRVEGFITISGGGKTIELRHYTQLAVSSTGLGVSVGDSRTEVFSQLFIEKLKGFSS